MAKQWKDAEERKEYFRKKMAESRARKAREEAGVPLGATHRRVFKEDGTYEDKPLDDGGGVEGRLPWPMNQNKAGRWGVGVEVYIPLTEEEEGAMGKREASVRGGPKEATDEEWGYALVRAGRARKYFKMFPEHVKPGEMKYQDPAWQWENQVKWRRVPE